MSTTIVPEFNEPVVVATDDLKKTLQEWLERSRGDEDKASTVDDSAYWGGMADAFQQTLAYMTDTKFDTGTKEEGP